MNNTQKRLRVSTKEARKAAFDDMKNDLLNCRLFRQASLIKNLDSIYPKAIRVGVS